MRSSYEESMAPLGWLTPTAEAIARFAAMSRGVSRDEVDSQTVATDRDVAVATVHARQDIAGLVSLQFDLHRQLVNISRGVWVGVVLLIIAVFQGPIGASIITMAYAITADNNTQPWERDWSTGAFDDLIAPAEAPADSPSEPRTP